jgi:hypothetical protein
LHASSRDRQAYRQNKRERRANELGTAETALIPEEILMSTGATVAAAAAAAAELQRQEEEEMTPYSTQDLADGWEFKILRSNFGAFRNQERLRAVLEEEKRGGWTLVEKFDDQRIRLKRLAATKPVLGDFADGYDPYRTTLGMSQGAMVLTIAGVSAGLVFGLAAVAMLLATH